jgi:hypothetical protein
MKISGNDHTDMEGCRLRGPSEEDEELEWLLAQGFDLTIYDSLEKEWIARCSQCCVTTDQGVPSHEEGCIRLQQ